MRISLFDRTASGFQINGAGVVVLGMADQIYAAIEAAEAALAGLSGLT